MTPKLLETAERAELVALWVEVFGHVPAATLRPELLRPVLAHGLQRRRTARPTRGDDPVLTAAAAVAEPLTIGSKLLRTWDGETHEVFITARGFEYRGEVYRALSPIANLITGSRWSGPVFFGLKKTGSSR